MGEAARATGPDGIEVQPPASSTSARASSEYVLRPGAEPILLRTPGLRALLDETCAQLRRVFGPAGELAVTSFEDPETREAEPTLFVLVRTTPETKIAADLLDRFDETWWLDNAPRTEGKIEVSLEFA